MSIEFSLLMSVYINDNPQHFKRALESSILDQILCPNELVLVVDGKVTEDIDRIIHWVSNLEIKSQVIRLEENVGLGNALNEGLKYCSYKYVARMDSDDVSVPDRFEKQIKFLDNNKNISVLGSFIGEFISDETNIERIRKVPLKQDGILKMIKSRNPMNHVSVIMNREHLTQVGNYTSLLLLEDYLLWIKFAGMGFEMANTNDVLVNVRTDQSFSSKRSSKLRIKGWRTIQKYLRKYDLVSFPRTILNLVMINVFVYTPPFIKDLTYKFFLRENNNA